MSRNEAMWRSWWAREAKRDDLDELSKNRKKRCCRMNRNEEYINCHAVRNREVWAQIWFTEGMCFKSLWTSCEFKPETQPVIGWLKCLSSGIDTRIDQNLMQRSRNHVKHENSWWRVGEQTVVSWKDLIGRELNENSGMLDRPWWSVEKLVHDEMVYQCLKFSVLDALKKKSEKYTFNMKQFLK